MEKINIELLKMRLHIEKDEKRRKEIEDILEKDDEKLADLYMKKYHKTIEEKREEIANALKIKVDDVIYNRAEKFISGNRNIFEIYNKTIKHFNIYSLNEHKIYFYDCDINFVIPKESSIYAEDINFKSLSFFNCKINIDIYDNFCCENMHFKNCEINSLKCSKAIINGNIKFSNSIFKDKIIFGSCIFKDNIYFNNSHFKDYVDFHACEFEKTACFYGAKFEKVPNFSACYFKDQKAVNLINVDIDKLNFKSVENYIKDNYKDKNYKDEINETQDEKSISKIENKYKLKCAKDCKDSFRVIKDVLTNQNNTLEAQEWHKLELYAKEKELLFEVENCHSKNNMRLVAIKSQDKNSINLTVDLLLLCIYRITSLHHTSFTRIINFTSWNIAIFGILIYLMSLLSLSFDEKSIFWFWGIFIFIIMSMLIVWKVFERKKLYAASLISYTFVIFLAFIYLVINMTILSSFWYITFAALAYCFFVIILCYFYSCIETKPKLFYWLNCIVYIILISIIIVKPQLINPFMGVFSSDKIYESQLEKKLNDFNTSAILNLAKISQKDFNLSTNYKDISFTELNSAKKIIIDNKENLKEILSSIYNKEHKENYKRVLQELENNASNLKNIIQQIDKKNNNSFISARLYEFLKSNFGKFNDLLYLIKSNFSFIAKKLTPQKLANFDKKDNQEKLKNILSLLKFEQKFEEVAQTINQDKIMQEALKSTSILYSIILLLCVFSLQKTARKNSIVPS